MPVVLRQSCRLIQHSCLQHIFYLQDCNKEPAPALNSSSVLQLHRQIHSDQLWFANLQPLLSTQTTSRKREVGKFSLGSTTPFSGNEFHALRWRGEWPWTEVITEFNSYCRECFECETKQLLTELTDKDQVIGCQAHNTQGLH